MIDGYFPIQYHKIYADWISAKASINRDEMR